MAVNHAIAAFEFKTKYFSVDENPSNPVYRLNSGVSKKINKIIISEAMALRSFTLNS